ncbi:large ribosomal subunit protein uL22m isoform X2 [Antennarius striatus]|uniref:large ribosomal subunit protein uL22m isoform X2 n=1 Tax=Antennarius striatus TaxID=241820 RepID=UPI0035B0D9F6
MAAAAIGRGLAAVRNISGLFCSRFQVGPLAGLHTSGPLQAKSWERRNLKVHPPQGPEEPPRPAEVHHSRRQIKYSRDKMWYLTKMVRGMSIDQAVAQLEFNDKKGAKILKEVLLEAQEMAVRTFNVEYKSNLYVAECFSGRGTCLKRIRYHGRGMAGVMEKVYCHVFVKLVEGAPPTPPQRTTFDLAKEYVQSLKSRTIIHSL